MSADSILSPFTAIDGRNIALHDWPLPEIWNEQDARGTVILVHGLGEHALRYSKTAQQFNAWGYHVRGYDHYGHGESGGERGGLPSTMRLVDDLVDVIDETVRTHGHDARRKLFLLGHSLGGLVVASFVRQQLRQVDGIILSSPALDAGLNAFQKFLVNVLPRFTPNLRVNNGLDVLQLCRDPAVVQAYVKDSYVHKKISARLGHFIATEGAACVAAAPTWQVPTLLIYAGADKLVNPAGSHNFASAAPKSMVQAQCFEPMMHEILNDPERELVFARIGQWLAQR